MLLLFVAAEAEVVCCVFVIVWFSRGVSGVRHFHFQQRRRWHAAMMLLTDIVVACGNLFVWCGRSKGGVLHFCCIDGDSFMMHAAVACGNLLFLRQRWRWHAAFLLRWWWWLYGVCGSGVQWSYCFCVHPMWWLLWASVGNGFCGALVVNVFDVRQLVMAFACVGWWWLLQALAGNGIHVHWLATAFECIGWQWLLCALDGNGIHGHWQAMAFICVAFVGIGGRQLWCVPAGDDFCMRRMAIDFACVGLRQHLRVLVAFVGIGGWRPCCAGWRVVIFVMTE